MKAILIGILLCGLNTAAQAATVQYKFNITDSQVDYSELHTREAEIPIPDTEYGAFVAANHTLRALIGLTGEVIIRAEVTEPELDDPFTGVADLFCISGLLCGQNGLFIAPDLGLVFVEDTGFDTVGSAHMWGLRLPAGGGQICSSLMMAMSPA